MGNASDKIAAPRITCCSVARDDKATIGEEPVFLEVGDQTFIKPMPILPIDPELKDQEEKEAKKAAKRQKLQAERAAKEEAAQKLAEEQERQRLEEEDRERTMWLERLGPLGRPGVKLQAEIESVWVDCSPDVLKQICDHVAGGSTKFLIQISGAMYIIDWTNPSNASQKNARTGTTRKLRLEMNEALAGTSDTNPWNSAVRFGDSKLDAKATKFSDLAEAFHRTGLGRFWSQVLAWCTEVGVKSIEDVGARFDELTKFLGLDPFEKCALRRRLVLPVPKLEDMILEDVAAELAVDAAQFRQTCYLFNRLTFGTVQDVVNYFQENGMLLSASQANQVFGIVLPKVSARHGSQHNIRSQLVMALHRFCVEPYVFWEDDGDRQCLWSNMTYNDIHLWDSGLCQELDGRGVGEGATWERVTEGSCKGGCGFFAGQNGYCSLCSVGKGPKYPGGKRPETIEEARRLLRRDVNGLRDALKAYRQGNDRRLAVKKLLPPKFYDKAAA